MADDQTATHRGKMPFRWPLLFLGPLIPILSLSLAIVVRVAGWEAYELEGPSMEPALYDGDRLVVDKHVYGLFFPFAHAAARSWAAPELGDIVVLHAPDENIDMVKRIVGLPGDTIEVRGDTVIRNGTGSAAVEVPSGHVFVLGDHGDRSNDSRFFGPVPFARLKGRVAFVYFASDTSRIGRVPE